MNTENNTLQFPDGLLKNYFGNDRIADFSTSKNSEQRIPVSTELNKKDKPANCVPGKNCN